MCVCACACAQLESQLAARAAAEQERLSAYEAQMAALRAQVHPRAPGFRRTRTRTRTRVPARDTVARTYTHAQAAVPPFRTSRLEARASPQHVCVCAGTCMSTRVRVRVCVCVWLQVETAQGEAAGNAAALQAMRSQLEASRGRETELAGELRQLQVGSCGEAAREASGKLPAGSQWEAAIGKRLGGEELGGEAVQGERGGGRGEAAAGCTAATQPANRHAWGCLLRRPRRPAVPPHMCVVRRLHDCGPPPHGAATASPGLRHSPNVCVRVRVCVQSRLADAARSHSSNGDAVTALEEALQVGGRQMA